MEKARIMSGMRASVYDQSLRRFSRISLVALAFSLGGQMVVTAPAAWAQAQTQRTVQGKVVNKSDVAVKGAVVYLKDDHTLAIKSFIADDAGGYRFGQLSATTDYEIWAEIDGKKSGVKTISSFDSKNSFTINLKVDTGS